MRYSNNAMSRILSLILAFSFLFAAFPVSASGSIDEPLNGVVGNGWDDFGGSNFSDISEYSDGNKQNQHVTEDGSSADDNKHKDLADQLQMDTELSTP